MLFGFALDNLHGDLLTLQQCSFVLSRLTWLFGSCFVTLQTFSAKKSSSLLWPPIKGRQSRLKQESQNLARGEMVEGRNNVPLSENVDPNFHQMRIRAFPNNMGCILGVTKVTLGACGAFIRVNYVVVSCKMVMASHELDHLAPLFPFQGQNLV